LEDVAEEKDELPIGKEAKYSEIFQKFKLPLDEHLVDRM
jgi:hypothetical protein